MTICLTKSPARFMPGRFHADRCSVDGDECPHPGYYFFFPNRRPYILSLLDRLNGFQNDDLSLWAKYMSRRIWRFIQKSADILKYFARRKAVLGVIPLRPFTMSLTHGSWLMQSCSLPAINDIVNGRRGITPSTALRLAKYYQYVGRFWMKSPDSSGHVFCPAGLRSSFLKTIEPGPTS